MSASGNWHYPTSIRFGAGRIREIADACRTIGITRPLVVTDSGLARASILDSVIRTLGDSHVEHAVFAEVRGNPVEANVTAGVAAFRSGRHDGVIAFGGGSALDAGKAIALMVGQKRPLWDFEDREDWYKRVDVAGMAPVIAVPTTSGTGSEVGRASVITDLADHTKKIIFHPRMLPRLVIADPELTLGLPPPVTAAVGMDALSHNLEAYCATAYHPMADGIALEGMRLIHDWLPAACRDGSDLDARSAMMVASSMGATAFQKGLGAMHSLSHPCSANLDTHHGLTNAVVMPYVLLWNRAAIEERMARLGAWLGLENASFEGVLDWVLALRREIGIPHSLAELGLREAHAAQFAPQAHADPSTAGNPVPMQIADFAALYANAIRGELAEKR